MKATIKQNPESPIATEILAESIVTIARGMKRILAGPLAETAIILLIQDAAGGRGQLSKEDIKRVLHAASELEARYVRKPKKK